MLSRLLAPFLPYALAAALSAALVASVAAWWGWSRAPDLAVENDALSARLRASEARLTLLRNEMESDRAVDAIPDDGLRGAVDPRWLFDPAPR
jgi:hypothetical protein